MAKRASFLYEALGAKSRGGSSARFGRKPDRFGKSAQRAARSAAGVGQGAFSWVSNLFGGRRRRRADTGPLLMAVGAGLGLLAAGFLLGRFVGGGESGSGGALNANRPGYLISVPELTTPASDFGLVLVGWPDSEANRKTAIRVGQDLQGDYPRLRVVQRSNGKRTMLFLVCHVDRRDSSEATELLRMIENVQYSPHPRIEQDLWDQWSSKRRRIFPLG